ncbi:hypothetical protein ACP4OV_009906 [Aristida adscensionis]
MGEGGHVPCKPGPLAPPLWDADVDEPKEWFAGMAYAVPLGSGRFCIDRFFESALGEEEPQEYDFHVFDGRECESFAVFTGVEVERDGSGGELRMTIHGSKRYTFENKVVMNWVL